MSALALYRVFCLPEQQYVQVYSYSEPTECPNNPLHPIDSNATCIVEATGNVIQNYWIFIDEKKTGVQGGTAVGGEWNARNLNTVVYGTNDNDVVLNTSTGEFTVTASGTYQIKVFTPAYNVGSHRCRVYNVSDSSVVRYGEVAYTAGLFVSALTYSKVKCTVHVLSPTVYRIEHYCSNTNAQDGLGIASGVPNTNERYTFVEITRMR